MANKLLVLENELNKEGAFDGKANKTVKQMTDVLGEDVPFPMSLAIANYTMASFISHFHYKIELARDNLIPMNVIIFVLAKSGAKKTSSMLKLEKSLKLGYNRIHDSRRVKAELMMEEFELEKMPYIAPLDNALATEAGMIQRLNDFAKEGIGLPALYVDEISTELASNPDMIPNIKLVAQLFDVGDMKSKPLKDRNNQSDEVHGMGMCALFIGSEHGILEDPSVLTKFETEFMSKLARRSMFVYPKFIEEDDEVDGIEAILKEVKEKKDNGYELNNAINDTSLKIAQRSISNDTNNVKLSNECARLYTIYSLYCEEVAKGSTDEEAVILEQQHRHWKALKLAGVYSVFNGNQEVTKEDLIEAIYVVELTGAHIGNFIEKANRRPYEVMLNHYQEGGSNLSVHEMVKKKWINKPSELKILLELANSKAGKDGMVEEKEGIINYVSFRKTEGLGVSIKITENMQQLIDNGMGRREAKELLATKTKDGFSYIRTTFEAIGGIMSKDRAYIPFEQRKGIRGKDHIISGADFIVLDIDDTDISDVECADMLADYNYIIARGSDKDNPYKYRVLLPFDVTIDIENDKWKPFLKKVGEHLGLDIDLLAKSQFYFGYKGRELLTNRNGMDLEASELVKNIEAVSPKVKPLPPKQLPDAWNRRFDLFSNAYEAETGLGRGLHTPIWYATAQAHDLGFTLSQGLALLEDIIDYIEEVPRANFITSLKKRFVTDSTYYPRWVEEMKQNAVD